MRTVGLAVACLAGAALGGCLAADPLEAPGPPVREASSSGGPPPIAPVDEPLEPDSLFTRTAHWSQPGLFARLAGRDDVGAIVVAHRAPRNGIELVAPVDGIATQHLRLASVEHAPGGASGLPQLALEASGDGDAPRFGIRMLVAGDATRDERRAIFVEFARAVTSANESTIASWANDSSQPAPAFAAADRMMTWIPVEPPFRVGQLLAELDAAGPLARESLEPGALVLRDEAWTFTLLVSSATAELDDGSVAANLGVDASDTAWYWWRGPLANAEHGPLVRVTQIFEDLDLGRPEVAPEAFQPPVAGPG